VKTTHSKRLYELPEVAEMTSLKLGTVRQFVSMGIIPALYLGRKRVVTAEVVDQICREGLRTTKKETAPVDE